MAQLIYNGVPLPMVRTAGIQQECVYDPSGIDYLYTRYVFEVQTVLSAATLAGLDLGQANTSLAAWAEAVRRNLKEPRGVLEYNLDGVTMLRSPRENVQCDATGGPHVRDLRVTEVVGDKSLIVYFRVETCRDNLTNVFLSNRWTASCDTDVNGFSTRNVRGRAVVNLGELYRLRAAAGAGQGNAVSVDSFRSGLLLVPPSNHHREHVHVTISADGATLDYSYTDREKWLSIQRSNVTRVVGAYTGGFQFSQKSIQEKVAGAAGIVKSLVSLDLKGLAGGIIKSMIPVAFGSASCSVWGDRDSARRNLGSVATEVCLDRATVDGNVPIVVSAYCTYSVDEPMAEVRMEFMPTLDQQIAATVDAKAAHRQMNLRTDVQTPALSLRNNTNYTANGFTAASRLTRGTDIDALFQAALGGVEIAAEVRRVDPIFVDPVI